MLQNLLTSYGAINKIFLKENTVKIMETYDLAETLAQLMEQMYKGRNLRDQEGSQFTNAMILSKGITLL